MLKVERLLRIKFLLSLSILIFTAVSTLRTHAQSAQGIWSEPVNLSHSGAASGPMLLTVGQVGRRAIWMDRFDGVTSARQTDAGWEAPAAVPLRITITAPNGEPRRVPVTETPRIAADSQGNLHAVWVEPAGSQIGLAFAAESDDEQDAEEEQPQPILFYSRTSGDGEWTEPLVLARSVIDWQLVEDATGQLYVFYLRTGHEENAPAGVYTMRSSNGGNDWSPAQLIYADIYLRLLVAEDAHMQATTDGSTTLHVVWDDPHLQRSFYVRSVDGGATWSEPVAVGATEERGKRLQVTAGADGMVLRLWDATPEGTIGCSLYQQRSTDAGLTWSEPERVLETLSQCPATWRFRHSARGDIFWVGDEGSESIDIAAWNGAQWSAPKSFDLRFEGSAGGTPINLTSLQVALLGETLGVVGTGQEDREVWFVESQLSALEWAFAPPPAWSEPMGITSADEAEGNSNGETGRFPGLPAFASQDGEFHMVWSESPSPSQPSDTLYYSVGSGGEWTQPSPLRFVSLSNAGPSERVRADEPALVWAGEQLHLVWSGGDGGQILHSVTAADTVAAQWREPRPISLNEVVACCPSLTSDSQGVLHIVYAVPLNESRGLYYTRSEDRGTTWSGPAAMFDAAAEGWEMVTQPRVAVDNQGLIHVAWLRGVAPGTRFGSTEGIYYTHSRDGGESWSEPTRLMQGHYEWPLLLARSTGQLIVMGTKSGGSLEWFSRRSDDGGIGWSREEQIPGFAGVPGPVSLTTDGGEAPYLLGLRQEGDGESQLIMSAWNGSGWSPPETYGLNVTSQPGVAAALEGALGQLVVSFRRTSNDEGVENSTLWTTSRAVPTVATTPGPIFIAEPTQTPVPTAQPTVTATPRPDLSAMAPLSTSGSMTPSTPLVLSAALATVVVGGIVVIRSARRR